MGGGVIWIFFVTFWISKKIIFNVTNFTTVHKKLYKLGKNCWNKTLFLSKGKKKLWPKPSAEAIIRLA